jgi:hypothetical protein
MPKVVYPRDISLIVCYQICSDWAHSAMRPMKPGALAQSHDDQDEPGFEPALILARLRGKFAYAKLT